MASRPVRRQVGYNWQLRELMAARGLFNATDLEPLLAERGITLSSVQVWRLVLSGAQDSDEMGLWRHWGC
jgi:hypothetical protein